MTNPGDQTNNENDTVNLSVTAADATSGATLKYTAIGLPPGLQINTSTGQITGTVGLGASAGGPYTVTVIAGDGTNSASQTFAWNVNSPITITGQGDQTNNENDSVSLSITASDSINGSTVQYAAIGLPPGLQIDSSSGDITGTVAAGDAVNSPYSVTVIAEDGTYSSELSFNWTVNSPVTITTPDTQTNNEGDSVTLGIAATDTNSGTLTYSAQGLPAGLSINSSTGVISGTVVVGDSNIGTFNPTIIVNDGSYYSTTTFEWDVNSLITITDPGDQANTVGDTVSLQIDATDGGSGTMVYGASGLPAGLSINTSTGLISGTITSGATLIGSYSTTVTASDGTYFSSDTFAWTVTAAGTVTMTTPNNQSGTEGTPITTLTISASGGMLNYFAEGLPAGLIINPSSGSISGTPAVGDAVYSPYAVTVVASNGSNFAEETFSWTITSPVTLSAIPDQTNNEGDTATLGVTGSDSSGTLSYTAVGLPTGLKINTTTGTITGTVAPGAAANGPYSVTVIANDGTYSASQTFNWTVNSPITFTSVPADQSNVEGDDITRVVAFCASYRVAG